MMVLLLKAFVVCVLMMSLVEPAKLPRKAMATDNDMPVLDVLKSEGYLSSHNAPDGNDTSSSFDEQAMTMLKKFYMSSPLISVGLHPNLTKGTSQINHHLRQRMKRNPRQCVPDPVVRCERDRRPKCLTNVGCKGKGSCGGTCSEVRLPLWVIKFKGVQNGQSIYQPDVILVSTDCVCT